jgi:hypothetical protein
MFCVRLQVCAGCEESIIEREIKMMSLKIGEKENSRNGAGKLTKTPVDILGLQGNTAFKLLIMHL